MEDETIDRLKEDLEQLRWQYQNHQCSCNPYEEQFLNLRAKIDELEEVV